MPAAAVIPAPIVYISVVAVKTLVVGFWALPRLRSAARCALLGVAFLSEKPHVLHRVCGPCPEILL